MQPMWKPSLLRAIYRDLTSFLDMNLSSLFRVNSRVSWATQPRDPWSSETFSIFLKILANFAPKISEKDDERKNI